MDEPVPCFKCQSVPYDILMMNCNHNLCVSCAAERLVKQNISRSPTGKTYIQCDKCKIKTTLDNESLKELSKIRGEDDMSSKNQTNEGKERRAQTPLNSERVKKQRRKIQSGSEQDCLEHPQQPVMYFCFTCKCRCFCAECVLTGQHQDHDVKVVKKAFSLIQTQFKAIIEKTKKFIKDLHFEKKDIADQINSSKNKADSMKKSIQKAFNEVRELIRQKQIQFMKIVDSKFQKSLQVSNGVFRKQIETKLKQNEQFLKKLETLSKKGEVMSFLSKIWVLNCYSEQWESLINQSNEQVIIRPEQSTLLGNNVIDYIGKIKQKLEQVVPASLSL